ncbi:MAG: hypothetical protein SFX19_02185 [Alphaproteobacteria bacterium]|nr:hypothetical protein [Alphaproteobacteria bacterium]
MFARSHILNSLVLFTCIACAPKQNDKWTNIDYSKVYKAAGEREIDNRYRSPTVVGCVDDDLFNCK